MSVRRASLMSMWSVQSHGLCVQKGPELGASYSAYIILKFLIIALLNLCFVNKLQWSISEVLGALAHICSCLLPLRRDMQILNCLPHPLVPWALLNTPPLPTLYLSPDICLYMFLMILSLPVHVCRFSLMTFNKPLLSSQ